MVTRANKDSIYYLGTARDDDELCQFRHILPLVIDKKNSQFEVCIQCKNFIDLCYSYKGSFLK